MSYRLARADLYVVTLPFRFRFDHAAAKRRHNQTIYIKLTTACGRTGWGETVTRPYLTGETPETVVATVAAWWPDLCNLAFDGSDPGAVLSPLQIDADRSGKNAAWSLVDIACYDLWLRGRQTGERTPGRRTPVSLPIGLGAAGALLPYIGRAAGFERFKFKVGRDYGDANGRLAAAGATAVRAVDANMAFRSEDVVSLPAWLRAQGIQYIEQPFPAGDDDSAAALSRSQAALVVADESLCSARDAQRLISARAAGGFNVRLAKLGGITGARAIVAMARAHGIKVQLGALVGESDLLSNAARFCLPEFAPDLFEYSFPGILLSKSPVTSDLPRWAAQMPAGHFAGTGFGCVDEPWLLANAAVHKALPL